MPRTDSRGVGGGARGGTGGVALAAGLSRRMGRAKLLLDWGGKPVVRRVVEQVKAGRVDEVLVVLGHEAPTIREALKGLPVRFVENPEPEAGRGGSTPGGGLAPGPGA